MIDFFKITIFPSTVKPIQMSEDGYNFISVRSYIRNNFSQKILESKTDYEEEDKNVYYEEEAKNVYYEDEVNDKVEHEFTAEYFFKDLSKETRELLEDGLEVYENNEEKDDDENEFDAHVINKDYVISCIENIYNTINNLSVPVIIEKNPFFHLGWKQLYNNFVFLDVNQKDRELDFFTEIDQNLNFYPLDRLISLLKTDDPEFTMTAFAFTLFSATKSLYKAPKNSFVKDIRLSVLVDNEKNIENACNLIEKFIKTIVRNSVFFDYTNGKPHVDPIKEYNILNSEPYYSNDEDCTQYTRRIKHTTYNVDYVDYPIIVKKAKSNKHNPNKYFDYSSASPIFINYIDTSTNIKSMYIPVYPHSNIAYTENVPRTDYLSFLESKLSSIADDKFKSKGIFSALSSEITEIINQPNGEFFSIKPEEIAKIEKCIFGLCFHKNQKITYFDDLYNKAQKQLSFPDSDPDKVKKYSYLLASLISFKEYVDELPIKKMYTSDEFEESEYDNKYSNSAHFHNNCDISTYQSIDSETRLLLNEVNDLLKDNGIDDENCVLFDDIYQEDDDDEESSPTSATQDTDITSYKEEFYALFDQTVEIFKKRCAVNGFADHTMSYEDKLVLYFEQFITELQSENSDLIIKPAKEKQGLIFLDFYRYFDRYELFLAKQNFDYTISKQKFNRLLYDNKILKPRYNGNGKTPPKLDYIMKSDQKEYTVLAIKLEVLKSKCAELSK